jgi:hypothetical protein
VRADKALAKIPAGNPSNTEQRVHMALKLAANGSATGVLQVQMKGAKAAHLRDYMRNLQGENERDFVKKVLSSSGWKGKGKLEKGDLSEAKLLSDQYAFSVAFDIDNYLPSSTQGAFKLGPVISLPLSISRLGGEYEDVAPRRRSACFGYNSYESYDLELAPGVTFTQVPSGLKTRNKLINYTSSYQRNKSGFKVVRELKDSTPDGVCSAEYLAQWNAEVKSIADNLQQQVFYKHKGR